MRGRGLILAAPASGSGKTLVTAGLLRHLRERGIRVAAAKAGPDYIDPTFHAAASGGICLNLDLWAMRPATLAGLVGALEAAASLVLCEGVMGLFDGTRPEGETGPNAAPAPPTACPVLPRRAPPPPGPPAAAAVPLADPAVLEGGRGEGAELSFFSPLADEAPDPTADAVYLPGGYPELHAGRLAASGRFVAGLQQGAMAGTAIYGECGGYMVLGEALSDAEGRVHRMAGLLPLATSFADRRLHLGYRAATLLGGGPLGPAGARFRGHEFHYATTISAAG